MNFKEETLQDMRRHGYDIRDIQSIQIDNIWIPVNEFFEIADFDYYAGYGWPEIRGDLTIIMRDGTWFSREEYDGSEWGEYHKCPDIASIKLDHHLEMLDLLYADYSEDL